MLNPFVSGGFLIRRLQGVGFFDENEMLQNKSPIIYMTYVEHIHNTYIRGMCTRLYARMLPLMPHGLTSMASVNSDVSGGIPCQIIDNHSLHKIWLRTSCVIIFR